MRGIFTIFSFISVVFSPWPITAILALVASFFEPLVPLAVGLFADTLYYTPQASSIPIFTICGAFTTAIAFFVRSRLKTSIIGE